MQAVDVIALLADFKEQGFACWVSGGWGVDALAGVQTRLHQDLDIAVDARQLDEIMAHLTECSYQMTVDWLPVRAEMTSPAGAKIDLHPVVFDAAGNGRQADFGDEWFDYPADQFTSGEIAGVTVPCIGKALQITFHQGYTPREIDLLDLQTLARL